jgi:hypothetical protein
MKHKITIYLFILVCLVTSCTNNKLEEKGFPVGSTASDEASPQSDGLNRDSLKITTQPSNVLLTGDPDIRLTSIFKVNYDKRNNTSFIGSNAFHYQYGDYDLEDSPSKRKNLIPGFTSTYGYNMVNISHYSIKDNKQKFFFEKPVLIKTVYYPTFRKDSTDGKPVFRNYFMVSAYNEDSNKDGFINLKDLRRIFYFNVYGETPRVLIPENYSVLKSEYDSANDFMFIHAKEDANKNGAMDGAEPIHIFWINLRDPSKTGRQF